MVALFAWTTDASLTAPLASDVTVSRCGGANRIRVGVGTSRVAPVG